MSTGGFEQPDVSPCTHEISRISPLCELLSLKKVEGHENITIAAQAAAQASAPDAPDGAAAAAGDGDLEGTTGDPEVDDILKASKSVNHFRAEF